MNDSVPRTPEEWLIQLAALAERYPFDTLTSAGDELQRALSQFLRNVGNSRADLLDAQADLLTLLPRFLNATILPSHHGEPCVVCSKKLAVSLGEEIVRDALEHFVRGKENGGMH